MKKKFVLEFELPQDQFAKYKAEKADDAFLVLEHFTNFLASKLSDRSVPETTRMTYEFVNERLQELLSAYEIKIG